MRRPRCLAALAVATLVLAAPAVRVADARGARPQVDAAATPVASGFVLIANASNPATSITKLDALRIFTKKARAWPGGSLPAEPVDQRDASPARKEFLATVMGKDAAAMNAYWQSQLFVGRTTPPPVKGSDADVIAFVAGAKGGIGYVAPGTSLPETVKAIRIGE